VTAGSPSTSYLIHKLNGTAGQVGGNPSQMPLFAAALTAEQIEAITGWITCGAPND
jgi:mono/diheme cytochrome c family protein